MLSGSVRALLSPIAYIPAGSDAGSGGDALQLPCNAFIAVLLPGGRWLMRPMRPPDATTAVDLPTAGRAVQRVANDIQGVPDTLMRVANPDLG